MAKGYFQEGRGSVCIAALLTMLIVMAVGLSLLTKSITEIKTSSSYGEGIAAQYLAESGVRYTQAWIVANGYPLQVGKLSLALNGSDSCTIQVNVKNGSYEVSSKAKVGNSSRQVTAVLVKTDAYDYTLFSKNGESQLHRGVLIFPGVIINGSIYSCQNISMENFAVPGLTGDSEIYGNIIAGGRLENNNTVNQLHIRGKVTEGAGCTDINPTNPELVQYNMADRVDLKMAKTMVYNSLDVDKNFPYNRYTLAGGDYFYEGDLILHHYQRNQSGIVWADAEYIEGPGTLIINGNIYLEQDAVISGPVLIMATGDIYIGSGLNLTSCSLDLYPATAQVSNAILIANNNIFINNLGGQMPERRLKGSLLAGNTAAVYAGAGIEYDKELVEGFRKSGKLPKAARERLQIVNWNNR